MALRSALRGLGRTLSATNRKGTGRRTRVSGVLHSAAAPACAAICEALEGRVLLSNNFTYSSTYFLPAPHEPAGGGTIEVAHSDPNASGGDPAALGFSPAGIRYADGQPKIDVTDLESDG